MLSMEYKLERIMMNFNYVDHNIGWKQNLMIMFHFMGNYQIEIIL